MQHSKVQKYCESVIEAGWLAALIVTPLFFNAYSSRVFEPDKITLVRSISLVMLLAYLVKLIDGGQFWLPSGSEPSSDSGGRAEAGGGALIAGGRLVANFWRLPLLLPVALLAAAYAISTIFSVSPYVSWWGSYHRLQGAYTFASYLIIAILTAAHLRQSAQLRRLQHTIILTSLPIVIYGLIQHFEKDPLSWGEDVTVRIAANAGNAIFLASYLIMAFFLTLERAVSSFVFLLQGGTQAADEAQPDVDAGIPPPEHSLAGILAGGCYLFVLVIQLLAIFWTQSRGPWLGLASGIYIFVLLLLTGVRPRNYRALTAVWVGLGVAVTVLLVLLNTTALGAGFRQVPVWGRLTTMLDSSSGTGRVRVLIWEGVAELVSPHEPLNFPDGKADAINPLRPLIGYGPEAMWMAFNRFYSPELAQWEARNRTPDRSHNETWDSLAMTGVLGFLANSLLFLSIFFWALRWLGLIRSRRDAALFAGLSIGGGLFLSAFFLLRGVSAGFLGVNWPTGLILGLIAYVTLAVFLQPESNTQAEERRRQFLIVALLSAIIAHYVEIHFGIAVAATRVYFWVFVAMLLALGMRWLVPESFAAEDSSAEQGAGRSAGRAGSTRASGRSRTSRGRRRSRDGRKEWLAPVLATLLLDFLVLSTVAFFFIRNGAGSTNPFAILSSSLFSASANQTSESGFSVFWLVLFTGLVAALLGTSASFLRRPKVNLAGIQGNTAARTRRGNDASVPGRASEVVLRWVMALGLYAMTLFAGWILYVLFFAGSLVPRNPTRELVQHLNQIAGLFSSFTWTVLFWCLVAGLVLAWRSIAQPRRAWMGRTLATTCGAVVLSAAVLFIVSNVNIAQVRADVFYKQGQEFDNAGDWARSADLYRRALAVRQSEDFYMLFYGRSLLARAGEAPAGSPRLLPAEPSLQDILSISAAELEELGQEELLRSAEIVLQRAQEVNPLNTDHTANLARLYRHWSTLTHDAQLQLQLLEKSLRYFEATLALSPNAAHLWNEKARVLALLEREEEAVAALRHSLSLDDHYESTYVQLGDMYSQMGDPKKSTELFRSGLQRHPDSLLLLSHLGVAQSRSGDLEGALTTNLRLIEKSPNNVGTLFNLVILNNGLGRSDEAIMWGDRAVKLLRGRHGGIGANISNYNLLVDLYLEKGRLLDAAELLQDMIELAPDEYRYPFGLAKIHSELGNTEKAEQFGKSALTLAPDGERPQIEAFINSLE